MADRFQISMMAPSEGRDYVTISISIFVKCGKCRFFANPVTYTHCMQIVSLSSTWDSTYQIEEVPIIYLE